MNFNDLFKNNNIVKSNLNNQHIIKSNSIINANNSHIRGNNNVINGNNNHIEGNDNIINGNNNHIEGNNNVLDGNNNHVNGNNNIIKGNNNKENGFGNITSVNHCNSGLELFNQNNSNMINHGMGQLFGVLENQYPVLGGLRQYGSSCDPILQNIFNNNNNNNNFIKPKEELKEEPKSLKIDLKCEETTEESLQCKICFINKKNCCFQCGHSLCSDCSNQITNTKKQCPFCNTKITQVNKLYL